MVTDGVALGHPCCAEHNCPLPLVNNRHRFCAFHSNLELECSVNGCEQPVCTGHLTCNLTAHVEIEVACAKLDKTFHDLRRRLRLHKEYLESKLGDLASSGVEAVDEQLLEAEVVYKKEGIEAEIQAASDKLTPVEKAKITAEKAKIAAEKAKIAVEKAKIAAEIEAGVRVDPVAKSDEGNRTSKSQFGRKHTHNEQLVVYCCGVIGGRATMFGAEAITGVKVDNYVSPFQNILAITMNIDGGSM